MSCRRLFDKCCTLAMYVSFLLGEPHSPTGNRLAEIMEISHGDSVNWFCPRRLHPRDLFEEACSGLNLKAVMISVDDSVLINRTAN
ncbi:MAG: hypothetical protein H6976_03500 [Gammaproteobacteria bacterium]|nr:hypothetical protein [Gammaproteobacteria bacterium]